MTTTMQTNRQATGVKIYLSLLAGVSLAASTAQAQTLFSQNFDGMTAGSPPVQGTDFTVVRPVANSSTVYSTVVPFGAGNSLQMYDLDATLNGQIQQDFTVSSAVRLSLSFTRNQNIAPANATSALFVSLGFLGGSQPNLTGRTMAVKLFNNGTFGFERGWQGAGGIWVSNATGSTVAYESPAAGPFGTHTLDIFAYAGTTGGSGISYTGPDAITHSLLAKSYSVFLDGALVTSIPDSISPGVYGFTLDPAAVSYPNPGDMGRFGLVTGGATSRVGIDFTVDNIVVSAIPEPSAFALLVLGFAVAGGRISRRRSGARN